MTSAPLIAGLDVGTTRIKAVVHEVDGRPVAAASRPTPSRSTRPDRVTHDPEGLWRAAADTLRRAAASLPAGRRVASIAVASMAEAGVPLDSEGRPTHDVIAWFDDRAGEQARALEARLGRDRLVAITGLRPQPIYGLCKLMWLRDRAPAAFARTRVWLNVADYLAYRLSGQMATDRSLASRTWALDLATGSWSEEILEAAGVPTSLLAPLVWAGTGLGAVTAEATRATGLPRDAVVAAGGHDHLCGALTAGVTGSGRALDSLGTAESLVVPLAAPLPGTTRISQGAHVVPGTYYAASGIHAGGASIDWALRLVSGTWSHGPRHPEVGPTPDAGAALGAGGSPADPPGARSGDAAVEYRSRLLAEAARVPPGSHGVRFLPDRVHDGPGAALVGLGPGVTGPAVVRAVLEGLALAARDILHRLLNSTGAPPEPDLRLIGGGTRIDLLLGIKAAVLDRPLTVLEVQEATALGAALLGACGAGLLPDDDVAVAVGTPRAGTVGGGPGGGLALPSREVRPDPAAVEAYRSLAGRR